MVGEVGMLDLKQINERRGESLRLWCNGPALWKLCNEDVPALVAEVRRLTAELEDLRAQHNDYLNQIRGRV